MTNFKVQDFNIQEYNAILAKGLSKGLGKRGGKICIEAAICQALGLPHGDDPGCVSSAVRTYKIRLNDSNWSSDEARAKGLRALGLAQLGSKGVVDDVEFTKRLAELTIREVLPPLFRQVWDTTEGRLAADRCEQEGTSEASRYAASYAAATADTDTAAADTDTAAAYDTDTADTADAAALASYVARQTTNAEDPDHYLNLSASLALRVLRELGSPGVELLG